MIDDSRSSPNAKSMELRKRTNKQKEDEVNGLRRELTRLQRVFESREEENKKIFKQQEVTKVKIATEMAHIHENLNRKSMELHNLKSTHEKLKSDYEKLGGHYTGLVIENSRLREENKTLKDQITPLNDIEAAYKEMVGKHDQVMAQIKEEKEHLLTRVKSRLEEDIKTLQCRITHLNNMESQYKEMIGKQKQEITQIKEEKEHLLTRLSAIAGERLTHDNVDIADLNDPNRPTKLSELYSELYDNEWTDAFEELTEALGFSEEKATEYLLNVIMNAYRKCKEITWDRYDTMKLVVSTLAVTHGCCSSRETTESQGSQQTEESPMKIDIEQVNGKDSGMTNNGNQEGMPSIDENAGKLRDSDQKAIKITTLRFDLSIDQERSLKNIWRATTRALKDESLKLLGADLMTSLGISGKKMPSTRTYLTGCIDLCFQMGLQEKPMYLDITAEKETGSEKTFDIDKFRPYTKSGKYAAYVVWPALFLHEGGAMLAKGIAQGCE